MAEAGTFGSAVGHGKKSSPHDVFISYSSHDKAAADAVCAILEREGISCWIAPRDIVAGDNWGASIVRAIGASRIFVLIFSKSANASLQVQREVNRAAHHELPIIPFRIEQVAPGEALEYYLSTPHWLDALTPPLERHAKQLADTVNKLLDREPVVVRSPDTGMSLGESDAASLPSMHLATGMFLSRNWMFAALGLAAVVLVVAIIILFEGRTDFSGSPQNSAAVTPPASDMPWSDCVIGSNPDSALRACTAIIDSGTQTQQNKALAYKNRGVAYDNKGDYGRAIQDFDEAIRLNPDFADAYNDRGLAYDSKGEHDRAILDYNEAIQLKPDLAEAYVNRGAAYDTKGDHDRAIQDYSVAIRMKPAYADVYNSRGFSYYRKGDHDHAIQDYNEAIRLKPDYAEAYNNRGFAFDGERDHGRAIQDYSEAISLRPDYADAYNNRALSERALGNTVAADADDAKARELGYIPPQ